MSLLWVGASHTPHLRVGTGHTRKTTQVMGGDGRPWVMGYELTWGLRSTSGQQINHLHPQDQSIMSTWWSRSENSRHWSSRRASLAGSTLSILSLADVGTIAGVLTSPGEGTRKPQGGNLLGLTLCTCLLGGCWVCILPCQSQEPGLVQHWWVQVLPSPELWNLRVV